jgi:hypothetical protein
MGPLGKPVRIIPAKGENQRDRVLTDEEAAPDKA